MGGKSSRSWVYKKEKKFDSFLEKRKRMFKCLVAGSD